MDAVHRRAGADHRIEAEDRLALVRHLFVQPVDQVDLGAHRVHAGRPVAHIIDDVLRGAHRVGGVDDRLGTLGMHHHAAAGVLLAGALDLVGAEADMHRAVPLPEQHAAVPRPLRLQSAQRLVRIPDRRFRARVDPQPLRRVATQMLIGEKEHLVAALEGPGQYRVGVGRGADRAAVASHERLQRGRRVHVGDRHHARDVRHLRQFVPRGVDIVGLRHIRHRAARSQIGQHHDLLRLRQDVRALGHEMHAAEDDEVGVAALRRLLRQLERVAAEVGELDDVVALVVVAQNHQPLAQLGPRRANPLTQLVRPKVQIGVGNLRLPVGAVRLRDQRHRGDVGLAGLVGQIRRQPFGNVGGGYKGGCRAHARALSSAAG